MRAASDLKNSGSHQQQRGDEGSGKREQGADRTLLPLYRLRQDKASEKILGKSEGTISRTVEGMSAT